MNASTRRIIKTWHRATHALATPFPHRTALAFAALLCVFVAVIYAQPILDGDLFWHLAYARQMLERGTLVPDHSAFSWTPASNSAIYCAWASEFVLYAIWRVSGFFGIFALRYLVVAGVLVAMWLFARERGLRWSTLTFLWLGFATYFIGSGAMPKPEMFSLVFFALLVCGYAAWRTRAADGPTMWAWCYGAPALVAVWANTHGGFILAAPFFAAVAAGEIALAAFKLPGRLSRPMLMHLLGAWALAVVTTCATPYGIRYPAALIGEYVLAPNPRIDVAWNSAYRSIFDPTVDTATYIVGLTITFGVIGFHAWRGRRKPNEHLMWSPLALAAVCYVPLYASFLRATQFLPIVTVVLAFATVAASAAPVQTLARRPRYAATIRAGAVLIALAGMTLTWARPAEYGWLGFGIGEINPESEANFLARQRQGGPIYNVFNSGGYLLWALYPKYRVMTDGRSFPYLAWFADQYGFTTGQTFEPFLEKYPADIAVIDLAQEDLWPHFLKKGEWRLVYFGATAAVFAKRDLVPSFKTEISDGDPRRFATIRSVEAAVHAFEFATCIGDYRAANIILERMENDLYWQIDELQLDKALAYRAAIRSLHAADYAEALDGLERALPERPVCDRDKAVLAFLVTLVRHQSSLTPDGRAKIVSALEKILPRGFDE